MGYAERTNPNSKWNRNKNKNFIQVSTPLKDEPMVIQLNPKNMLDMTKDFLCRLVNLIKSKPKHIPSLVPTN